MPSGFVRRGLVRALALSPILYSLAAFGQAGRLQTEASKIDAPNSRSYDLLVLDRSTGRKIGVRVHLPVEVKPTGLILYSPGLGSGLTNGAAWCAAWQAAGYVVVNLAHPLTDASIWNTERTSFQENLKRALSPEQYVERVKDCSTVLTYCLNDPTLAFYIDPARIGIAGHSYGALTVQAITGQLVGAQDLRDPRICAAIAFSPGAVSEERAQLMARVKIPFFSITGDHDQFVTFKDGKSTMRLGMALEKRLMIYEQLPLGHKQLLILANADHMSFAGEPVDPQRYSRDVTLETSEALNQWSRISDMSTIFWRYFLADASKRNEQDQTVFENQLKSYLNSGDVLKFG